MPPRLSLGPPLAKAAICMFSWLALSSAVWEQGMGGRRGRWGRRSKWVQFRTWAGMIKKLRLFTLHLPYGPSAPPPARFPVHTSYFPGWDNSLDAATLLGASHFFTLFEVWALCLGRILIYMQIHVWGIKGQAHHCLVCALCCLRLSLIFNP